MRELEESHPDDGAAALKALARLADEQAALRRVATLVAEDVASSELFGAVAREVGALLGADLAGMIRYEEDGTVASVATWAAAGEHPPVPERWQIQPGDPAWLILESRVAVRVEDWAGVPGPFAEAVRNHFGVSSSVGCPIVVRGRLWGALAVHSKQARLLPPDTEARIAQFTDLVATAIANTDTRAEVERLAAEQAALRRVATLVAQGMPSDALFDAVCEQVEALVGADASAVVRFETDDTVTVMGTHGVGHPVKPRPALDPAYIVAEVHRTGRAARFDTDDPADPRMPGLVRAEGIHSGVASPIVVEGELWGAFTIASRSRPLPAGVERRLADFTELVATAIANADNRDQLISSRARVLGAGDEARRRVVRDLHDGAQQRLVHTIVTLKLAQRAFQDEDGEAESLLGEALEQAERGNQELRDLAHGILPQALARGGLPAGVRALVEGLDLPVEVTIPDERYPREIEASAYFIVAEALTNVLKHSHAGHAEVTVSVHEGALRVEVHDDGSGGADPGGHGLVGMRDRVTTLGGRLAIESPAGGGTLVAATLPLS